MPPEDFYITQFTITLDEFKNIFPWFENLGAELEEIEKPKSKRGRKPKAHRAEIKEVEMKASN